MTDLEDYAPEQITKWKTKDAAKLASMGELAEAEGLIARPAALADMEEILDNIDMPEIDMLPTGTYPPTNIIRTNSGYRIEIAVAGFFENDFTVTVKDNSILIIKATPATETPPDEYIFVQGIAKRKFQRSFQLAKDVTVIDSTLRDGILTINLSRHVPEPKIKRIPINTKPQLLTENPYKRWDIYSPTVTQTGVGITGNASSWLHNSSLNNADQHIHDGAMAAPGVDITVQHK